MSRPLEIMAPAGSFESLAAALNAGADSVYFGVGKLNMRARATVNFTQEDLPEIIRLCRAKRAKAYLTLNTIIYNNELEDMRHLCDAAKSAGADAVIASDMAVISYARSIGLPVHMSVQANVCNKESVRFFSSFADVMVLAREMTLPQIREIIEFIDEEALKGPSGEKVRIEIFAHGALCVAVSGKCYMSLAAYNSSANRGACYQSCRRAYRVIDEETGYEMVIDNKYVMSPKDICTIRVLDQLIGAGVSIFKLEGRGRSADYVQTVTSVYKEASLACLHGSFDDRAVALWEERLSSVFNRGFWHGGYYLGENWGEWSGSSNNRATRARHHAAKVVKYYPRPQVAELYLEASALETGQELLVSGPSTGAVKFILSSMKKDEQGEMIDIDRAEKGDTVFLPVPEKIRKNDIVYLLKKRHLGES